MFYDKLFSSLDFTLPRAATGRRGFPKEAMVCAFIVMKCEGFSQITDLMDYLDNNRLIAHYCGFNIMEPLPSYWTYGRFLRQLDNARLKSVRIFIFPITKVHFNRPQTLFPPLLLRLLLLSHKVFHCPEKIPIVKSPNS